VVHEAGGGEALELALMAAAPVAYAKALVRAGRPMEDAFSRIVPGGQPRRRLLHHHRQAERGPGLWARITGAAGVDPQARDRGALVAADADPAKDAWTNMIRLTAPASPGRSAGRTRWCWAISLTPWGCRPRSAVARPATPSWC
jgi:methylmalonyl-CoA mutase